MAAALPGLFAVQHDQFVGRGRTANLFLGLQEDLSQGVVGDVFHQAAKGGLTGGGMFSVSLLAHAQRTALALAQALGKLGQIFLAPGGAAQVGQQADGDQAPQGVNANAGTVIR